MPPAVGSAFDTLTNASGSADSGAFNGLAEGTTFTVTVGSTDMTFEITYAGGSSGHDVVIACTALMV